MDGELGRSRRWVSPWLTPSRVIPPKLFDTIYAPILFLCDKLDLWQVSPAPSLPLSVLLLILQSCLSRDLVPHRTPNPVRGDLFIETEPPHSDAYGALIRDY